MGRLPGHRQVTLYIEPELYEKVRCTAYTLGEDIYEFVGDALSKAILLRLTKSQRAAVESMSKLKSKRAAPARRRNSGS